MATYSIDSQSFNVRLSSKEKRALGRSFLSFEKARVLAVDLIEFPGKTSLGFRVSKFVPLPGVMGEYRSTTKKYVVLGNLRGSGASLKITLSHPSIDALWICGSQAQELEKKLAAFLNSK